MQIQNETAIDLRRLHFRFPRYLGVSVVKTIFSECF